MQTADSDSRQWHNLRHQLLRFAQIQLPNRPDTAEDLVQETLLSAYSHQEQFQGGARFRTWVFAILKNKIVDELRQVQKHQTVFAQTPADTDLDEMFAAQFTPSGHWQNHAAPSAWHTPENALRQQQFQDILQACLYGLPESTARVFMMRTFLDFDTQEVCRQCGLSSTHYYVVMHRARESLRQCLQIKWFNGEKE